MLPNEAPVCTLGVLDHQRFAETLVPLINRARSGRSPADSIAELRAFVATIKDRAKREDATSHMDRIEVAVQGSRWHRNAAGQILEATCVEESSQVVDQLDMFDACFDYLYAWNPDHAETIWTFLRYLSDFTVMWASPGDTWRAVIPPDLLTGPASAMAELTPRELGKMLSAVEDAEAFSEAETAGISEWWAQLRKMVRLAERQDFGLLIAVKTRA